MAAAPLALGAGAAVCGALAAGAVLLGPATGARGREWYHRGLLLRRTLTGRATSTTPTAHGTGDGAGGGAEERAGAGGRSKGGRGHPGMTMSFRPQHFADYTLMLGLSCAVAAATFGRADVLAVACYGCAVWMWIGFVVRHGVRLVAPDLLARPLELPAVLLDKAGNVRPSLLGAIAVLFLEQAVVQATPWWPHHHVEAGRRVCWRLFYAWLAGITGLRVAMLLAHLWHRRCVFDFLRQSQWKKHLGHYPGRPGLAAAREIFDLTHAFATGLFCHILALGPLFLVLTWCSPSVGLLPVRLLLDGLVLGRFWLCDFNEWLYRDHWVAHHFPTAFVYLHGAHHDALPVGCIAAHDTAMLEGFLRFALGQPDCFLSPFLATNLTGVSVGADMLFHQFVPGVFPFCSAIVASGHRHVEHHFNNLHPLSSGFERDTALDTRLAGYSLGNRFHEWWLDQVARAHKADRR